MDSAALEAYQKTDNPAKNRIVMHQSKLLLVDDEQAFIEILAHRLRRRGFSVTCIESGQGALTRLEEDCNTDVIILDLKMPGMTGIEIIRKIKQKWPLIEVILLTGHASVESSVSALKQGAFDYLMKPYELDRLVVTIKAAILRKRHHETQIQDIQAKPYISTRDRNKLISRILDAARRGKSAG